MSDISKRGLDTRKNSKEESTKSYGQRATKKNRLSFLLIILYTMNSLFILIGVFILISTIIFMFGNGNPKPKPEPEPEPEPEPGPVQKGMEMIIEEEQQNRLQPVDAPIPPKSLDGIQHVDAASIHEGLTDFTSLESNECQLQLPQMK